MLFFDNFGPGRYNTETAQISESACQLCPIGKYSSVATATEDCSLCPYHSYSPARGAKACMPCEPGKNNLDQTASKCSDCPAGKSSKPGMWNSCPTNFTFYKSVCYQDLMTIEGTCESFGGSLCTSQELLIVDGTIGYNQSSSYCCRPPDFHGGDCELCKGNEYTPDAGYPICINCPSFQVPTKDKLGCQSASGYYTDVTIDGTMAFPTGEGVKPTTGTTLQSLELEPGYWRTSINDTLIRECPNPDFCIGGNVLNRTNSSLCYEGHEGPYCGACQSNYAMSQGKCVSCKGSKALTAVLISFAVIFGVIVSIYLYHYLKANRMFGESTPGEMKSMKARFNAIYISVKVQAKILASYFQITTSLAFNLDVFIDGFYLEFMKHLNFLNFDLGTVVPLGCMFEVNHISSLYSMTILSLVIIIGVYYRSYQLKKLNGKRKLSEGETDWAALLFNYLLVFTFLIFPTVSTKILHTFGCQEFTDNYHAQDVLQNSLRSDLNSQVNAPDEGDFLKIDLSLRCSDRWEGKGSGKWHDAGVVWAWLMVIVFPVGIPVAYLILMYNQRLDIDPGQNFLLGKRTAKRFDVKTRLWSFMEHKQKKKKKTRKLFCKTLKWVVADGFVDFSPSEVQQFIKKKEQEGEIGWTMVETMDGVEAMWCALFLRSKRETENPSLRQLQFLYETYEPRCWWFEVFETIRRLMLTGGLVLFNPGTAGQCVTALLIALMSMRVYAGYKPFIDDKHDTLAEAAQWQLYFTLLGSLCVRVNIYTETKQDKERFGDLLGVIQLGILILIVYQNFQKRRLREDGEGEEDVGVLDTLREIPGFKQLIYLGERFVGTFYSFTSKIVPDEAIDNMKQAFDDISASEVISGELMEQVMGIASGFFGKLKEKALDFAKRKVAQVEGTFKDAQAAKWQALEDEGVTDDFELVEKSLQAGFEALMELAKVPEEQRDVKKAVASSLEAAKGAVKDSIAEVMEEQKEKLREEVAERYRNFQEETKEKLITWVKDELKTFIEEELLPGELKTLDTTVEGPVEDNFIGEVKKKTLEKLEGVLDIFVKKVVGGAVDAIFTAASDPVKLAKDVRSMKLADITEGVKGFAAEVGDGIVEDSKALMVEDIEEFKEELMEDVGWDEKVELVDAAVGLKDEATGLLGGGEGGEEGGEGVGP
ncbi:hypothetical protein TrCOL_g8538 [Triparma columacea]|uniref:Tyrosine-protein kinase ephrin type A/B receptor-like domain-containing protein n=1 Tax=Triparma columacea TaxID=722753 RepID=A0A9W7GK48_9STRA|nr:hypothetical protein TrCOL_g8538 [Triparma columacea]